jgi:3-oxoacyl-[acyl-carrier-protein] synthase-1
MSLELVAISEVGLTSSLGWTAEHACAAARAGVTRTSELGYFVEDEEGEAAPVVGHAVRTLTDGFTGTARLARIGSKAIEDLCSKSNAPVAWEGSTALYVHVSDHYVHRARMAFAEDSGGEDGVRVLPAEWDGQAEFVRSIRERLLPAIARRGRFEPRAVDVVQGGPAGFLRTLESAAAAVARGDVDRAVVGAVDSLLDVTILQSMAELELLKTPQSPTGVMPGECAAFLLLEPTRRAGPGSVRLTGVARRQGTAHRFSGSPSTATELRQCVLDTFARHDPGAIGTCIASLNGDERRAHEYGDALLALTGAQRPTDFALCCPAASFGETGVATAPLSICLAARAYARDYARGRSILVAILADDAERASFFVTPVAS